MMKVSAWAASAAAVGLAAALAGCSGSASTATSANSPAAPASSSSATTSPSSASPAAPSPASSAPAAASVPAGYRRVSDPAQRLSFAVPNSWAAVNLAQETVQQAAQRLGLQGLSAQQLLQYMQTLQKQHALFVFDVRSGIDSPEHIATTLDAYCISSGVTDTGSAGLPALKQGAAAGMQQIHAGHIAQKDVEVGGIPGVRTSYTLSSSGAGTLEGQQLEVLPKPDRACFLTLTAPPRQFPNAVLPVVAATAAFS